MTAQSRVGLPLGLATRLNREVLVPSSSSTLVLSYSPLRLMNVGRGGTRLCIRRGLIYHTKTRWFVHCFKRSTLLNMCTTQALLFPDLSAPPRIDCGVCILLIHPRNATVPVATAVETTNHSLPLRAETRSKGAPPHIQHQIAVAQRHDGV